MSPMSQRIIIDGYNVIYTDDRLRRKACKDLEGARAELLEMLKGYVRHRRLQVTVVFDGRGGVVEAESIVADKLQVMFSPASQTADEVIVSTVIESANPRSYIVVTSDQADIGSKVRQAGSKVVGSKSFLGQMEGGHTEVGPKSSGANEADYGDTDYWLDKFTDTEDPENTG